MKVSAIKKTSPKKSVNKPKKVRVTAKKAATHTTTLAALSKPIDALCRQIETNQRQLVSLLKSTRLKIEKALQTNKTKLATLIAQEKKQQATLKTCQANYKNKPTQLIKTALNKVEHKQRAITTALERTKAEQMTLLSELRYYQALAKENPRQKASLRSAKPTIATKSFTATPLATAATTHTVKPPVSSKKSAAPMKEPMKIATKAPEKNLQTKSQPTLSLATHVLVSEETSSQPGSQCVS